MSDTPLNQNKKGMDYHPLLVSQYVRFPACGQVRQAYPDLAGILST